MIEQPIPKDFQILIKDNFPKFLDQTQIIRTADQLTATYAVLLNQSIDVLDKKFWTDIAWMLEQNRYLDVLKHPAWIALNQNYVKIKDDKNYWEMNLRPAHFFDDSTWRFK